MVNTIIRAIAVLIFLGNFTLEFKKHAILSTIIENKTASTKGDRNTAILKAVNISKKTSSIRPKNNAFLNNVLL
jgi:hypothetical protein